MAPKLFIAFATGNARGPGRPNDAPPARTTTVHMLSDEFITPLFYAVIEATEEAIYNSLFRATTVRSARRTVEALPLERVREILQRHGIAVR